MNARKRCLHSTVRGQSPYTRQVQLANVWNAFDFQIVAN